MREFDRNLLYITVAETFALVERCRRSGVGVRWPTLLQLFDHAPVRAFDGDSEGYAGLVPSRTVTFFAHARMRARVALVP
jgi:hypothetical protein